MLSKDVHNHLLPAVDDGFQNAEDSLKAIRKLSEQGCRELVFTPHFNPDVYPDMTEEKLRAAYQDFVKQIPSEWNVRTSLAAEYMIVNGFHHRVEASPETLLSYEDGSVLIEMSYMYKSRNLEDTIFALNMAGKTPILAHPERYTYMADRLSDFERLAGMGCRFQMNYLSLSGMYGRTSMKILNFLLKNNLYSFAATDLHSLAQLDKIIHIRPAGLMTGPRFRRFCRSADKQDR